MSIKMNFFTMAVLALTIPQMLCYDEKYDKLETDKILADDKMFEAYINCLLDKGDCTVEYSADFRKLVPEVVADACAKCNAIQRQTVRKTVRAMQEKRPDDFKAFMEKYDPKGEHLKDLAAFMAKDD